MANRVNWFEVLGKDTAKLRAFYGGLFGWKFRQTPSPSMDYTSIDAEPTGIGGGIGKAPPGSDGWVTFYVEVEDPASMIEQAQRLGSKVLMPLTELPDVTVAVISDPEGRAIGLAKTKPGR